MKTLKRIRIYRRAIIEMLEFMVTLCLVLAAISHRYNMLHGILLGDFQSNFKELSEELKKLEEE